MSSQLPAPCWVLHDGRAGNRRQACALADALGLVSREWPLEAHASARWFAPRRLPGQTHPFGREFSDALRSPPSLAIGCGRIAALATRLVREAGGKSVQILDPRIRTDHWDLVVAPEHDGLTGNNVITLLGSLSPVDDAWLARAREMFPALAALASPRTAILLGGPTAAVNFDRSALEVLLAKLEYWLARDGGSLVICASARTPRAWAALLRDRYRADGRHRVWMDASDGDNPYAGALGWADRIVVSPDSVNMVSEACATRVPVYVAEPGRARGRVGAFLASLQRLGRIQAQARDVNPFPASPLVETQRVAAHVRHALKLR